MTIRRDEGKTHRLAVERAMLLFEKSHIPLYVGQVALEVAFSLERTLKLLGELTEEGKVRQLNDEEKRQFDIDPACDVYVMVKSIASQVE